ncbi:protein tyrosine phosphatase [Legionella yabuuchiae]|uniref:protein tyrosine phosphatase n=1 Tax=Legionella yabuuchiae TaxID=376727 RepID=UPI001056D481|nr:protein tyrosine phosphatase [Legionella yabuuchiae]
MIICRWIFLFTLLLCNLAYSHHYVVKLGDETVTIHTIHQGKGKVFVHVHQNETTALTAALAVIAKEHGTVITLKHSGQRNIVFHLAGKRYEFDPNRMFTDVGIKKTLAQFGPYSPAAHREVNKLAYQLKQLIPPGKVIAVHNNRSYSLNDYLPGHKLAKDAQALHYCDKGHYRNFYLVTKKQAFQRLINLKFNSVLQAKQATDDGSLSVYLANHDYINVEAGYDQLAAQISMLQQA